MTTIVSSSTPLLVSEQQRKLFTDISIDGDTAVAFTENVEQRFLSYGWQVLHVDNGDR